MQKDNKYPVERAALNMRPVDNRNWFQFCFTVLKFPTLRSNERLLLNQYTLKEKKSWNNKQPDIQLGRATLCATPRWHLLINLWSVFLVTSHNWTLHSMTDTHTHTHTDSSHCVLKILQKRKNHTYSSDSFLKLFLAGSVELTWTQRPALRPFQFHTIFQFCLINGEDCQP